MARVEAGFAALKVLLAADYAQATRALAPPAASPRDRSVQEMVIVSEVACALTVSEGAAAKLLAEAEALTASLPLTLKALQAGTISWAHARAMVDETANLDPAGAAALEAHFLDPDAPNPARGCPAGDLVPHRFRSKVRTWRERHHPDSIEKRHAKSAKDRRVEFRPDSDGMAWFSAYLPADTAAGIWDRTTAAARALQGPDEPRTLTQLRADVAATLLLNTGTDADADATPTATALPGMSRSRGRRSSSPCPYSRCWAPRRNRRCWTGTGRSRRPWPGGWSPTAPTRSTGSWWTRGTGRRWKSGGPATASRRVCGSGSGSVTAGARSRAATTRPWTTTPTISWPRPTEAPPESTNLGQPCRKHHGLKHSFGWTPVRGQQRQTARLDLTVRKVLPSEQQDWEPPHWPPGITATEPIPDTLMDSGLPAYPGWDPDPELPPDPDRDPNLELPPDPFSDWYEFTAGHPWPAADIDHQGWSAPSACWSM